MEQTQILQLRDIALARAGAMWPNESVEEYLERVTSLAAQLHVGFTDREDAKSLFTTKLDALLAPPIEVMQLRGVLIDIVPRRKHEDKWDLVFLPAEGDFAMKMVHPSEADITPRPTYPIPTKEKPASKPGLEPATEIWHTQPFMNSPEGEALRQSALEWVGKGVVYEAHKDPEIWKDSKGNGYRLFDRFVESFELAPEMDTFAKRIINARERAKAAAAEYAA